MNTRAPAQVLYPNGDIRSGLRPVRTSSSVPTAQWDLSFRGLNFRILLVAGYLIFSRIGYLPAAKLGINIGPIPVFLTDIVLLALLAASFVKSPIRLVSWFVGGVGAGPVGGAVWLLCLAAIGYCVAALRGYGMFAIRDLAIFGYSLFFPLTYMAIPDRAAARKLVLYFIYAGVVLAGFVVVEVVTGVDLLVVEVGKRWLGGKTIAIVGTDDVGGIIAFSLVALLPYILIEQRRRWLHAGCAFVCVLALVLNTARCAVLATVAAVIQMFFLLRWRERINLLIVAVCGAVLVMFAAATGVLHLETLQNFYKAVAAGATGSDDSSQFRLERWRYAVHLWRLHPLLGNGFGVPLAKSTILAPKELEGQFNVGMPHNTFLFLLCRMGVMGLALVWFCWGYAWYGAAAGARDGSNADDFALANILVGMAVFGSFVLFFERPMNGAAFWIMAAVAARDAAVGAAPLPLARPRPAPPIYRYQGGAIAARYP